MGASLSPKQEYKTENGGSFLDGRIVVITDQYSASAAEILSGAIRDNDRGLIVGRRTFSKRTRTKAFPFHDRSMIRASLYRATTRLR